MCLWALERVQVFSYLESLKILFSSRRSSLTQTFVESCVDFEVTHLSVLMVPRLPYPGDSYYKFWSNKILDVVVGVHHVIAKFVGLLKFK